MLTDFDPVRNSINNYCLVAIPTQIVCPFYGHGHYGLFNDP